MKLFCMTYAGGSAAFYNKLEKQLPSDITLIKFEYSGHGERHMEPFYSSMEELAHDANKCLLQNITGSEAYAIMGYSMGSIGAVELLKLILRERKCDEPVRIFLAAHEPHTKAELASFDSCESDEIVKERTIRFGAIPPQLINNKSFWRMYMPMYKADYSIIGKYRFENLNLKTKIPATVFYSETDTPIQEMKKWKRYFAGQCDFVEFNGNHFFIQNYIPEIADIICRELRQN